MPVGVSQRRTTRNIDSQMIQLSLSRPKTMFDLPQRLRSADVAEQHRYQLLPACEAPRMSFVAVLPSQLLETTAWNHLEDLNKKAAKWLHRRATSSSSLFRKNECTRRDPAISTAKPNLDNCGCASRDPSLRSG